MSHICFVNNVIKTNLADNPSQQTEELEKYSILSEIRRNLCENLQTHKHSNENYYLFFIFQKKTKM